jgi:hypothetical protein
VDEALAACRGLVDRSLEEEYRFGNSAKALYDRYTSFGDDPFIMVLDGVDDRATFSAWTYAKERCSVICGESGGRRGAHSPPPEMKSIDVNNGS